MQDFKNEGKKEKAASVIANDIEKYNKGQCRRFFYHTRKTSLTMHIVIHTQTKEGFLEHILHMKDIFAK